MRSRLGGFLAGAEGRSATFPGVVATALKRHHILHLDGAYFMIDNSIMSLKTATVADLRNNFRRISAWIENGEAVEIVKRGRSFARLTPAATATPRPPVKVDFAGQLRSVWKQQVFSQAEVRAMRDAELGNQS